MNIQQIIYITEINKYNSFSVAANSLYISQPRLSQAVKDLETELGFEIFERNRKGIIGPTLKGYEFIHAAKKVLRDFNLLEKFKEETSQSFRLTTTLIPQAQDAFMELVSSYSNDVEFQFDMWFCGCFESCDKIRNSGYNIGVVTIIEQQLKEWKQYFNSVDLEYEELFSCPFFITVNNESQLAKEKIISSDMLRDHIYDKHRTMNDITKEYIRVFKEKLVNTPHINIKNHYPNKDFIFNGKIKSFSHE